MSLFCLCDPMRVMTISRAVDVTKTVPETVFLGYGNQLQCIKTGAIQVDAKNERQYPNVDLFQCPRCNVIVAKDR